MLIEIKEIPIDYMLCFFSIFFNICSTNDLFINPSTIDEINKRRMSSSSTLTMTWKVSCKGKEQSHVISSGTRCLHAISAVPLAPQKMHLCLSSPLTMSLKLFSTCDFTFCTLYYTHGTLSSWNAWPQSLRNVTEYNGLQGMQPLPRVLRGVDEAWREMRQEQYRDNGSARGTCTATYPLTYLLTEKKSTATLWWLRLFVQITPSLPFGW